MYFYLQHLALSGNLLAFFAFFVRFFFLTQTSLGLLLVYIGLSSGEGSLNASIFMDSIVLLSLLEGERGKEEGWRDIICFQRMPAGASKQPPK